MFTDTRRMLAGPYRKVPMSADAPVVPLPDESPVRDAPDSAAGRLLTAIYEMQDAEALYRARLRRKLGIGASELAAVHYIDRLGSRGLEARVVDVAAHLGVTTGAASVIVARLTSRGYITKRRDPLDGRGQHLDLTHAVRLAVETAAGSGAMLALTRGVTLSDRESRRMVTLLSTVTTGFGAGAPPEEDLEDVS
jgi:DNA-binding MarR family transcriptional regulator